MSLFIAARITLGFIFMLTKFRKVKQEETNLSWNTTYVNSILFQLVKEENTLIQMLAILIRKWQYAFEVFAMIQNLDGDIYKLSRDIYKLPNFFFISSVKFTRGYNCKYKDVLVRSTEYTSNGSTKSQPSRRFLVSILTLQEIDNISHTPSSGYLLYWWIVSFFLLLLLSTITW